MSAAQVWYRLGKAYCVQGTAFLPDALEAFTRAAAVAPKDAGRAEAERCFHCKNRHPIKANLPALHTPTPRIKPVIRAALQDVKTRITEAQQTTRTGVGRGLSQAFGTGLLYGGGGGGAAGGSSEDGAAAAAVAVGDEDPVTRGRREAIAAELVGRCLGLPKLHVPEDGGDRDWALARDPSAALMSAWFQPRC
jgi:hypothetical protein